MLMGYLDVYWLDFYDYHEHIQVSDLHSHINQSPSMTGAILFGGKSSRMGQPKHEVRLSDGSTFLERVLAAIRPLCSQIVLLGGHAVSIKDEFQIVEDLRPEQGPMGGIESLLATKLDLRYLIVACDQPLLTSDTCRLLLDDAAAVSVFKSAETAKYLPFPGIYSSEIEPLVSKALDEGNRSLQQLFRSLPTLKAQDITAEFEQTLRSFNTPDSLDKLEAILKLQSKDSI
ncbi:molybdenum cofactor guanylyltransferase [bacterium]|nr:MAG: molybdenum cofactor guanylyltransferase [bacterium]